MSDPCHQIYPLEFSIHGLWDFDVYDNFIGCPNMVSMEKVIEISGFILLAIFLFLLEESENVKKKKITKTEQ